MKVGDKNGVDPHLTAPDVSGEVAGARSTTRGPAGVEQQSDAVHLSDVARALAKLITGGGAQADPGRAARLEALKAAVASGSYRPDPREVAKKLLIEVASELVR